MTVRINSHLQKADAALCAKELAPERNPNTAVASKPAPTGSFAQQSTIAVDNPVDDLMKSASGDLNSRSLSKLAIF